MVDELGLSTCSMGMTDDLEVAVEEGSTQVRLGTALFGVASAVAGGMTPRSQRAIQGALTCGIA